MWEQTKLTMMESLWEAQRNLNMYRAKQNPKYWDAFKNQCISCWIHIRPYRDKFKKKSKKNEAMIAKLETMIGVTPILSAEEWIDIFKFLGDAYKRLGISDVGKMEDEDEWKTAMLDGFFDND